MEFVGRETEIKEIKTALGEEKNVIVAGKYGIGRTSLIRHLAETTRARWRFLFVDFSRPPKEVCNHLLGELFPEEALHRNPLKYKSSRFRIATFALDDRRKHILVLDNLSKLSVQKHDLLRILTWEKRFQFVSIVESFLPAKDLFRLRVRMTPSTLTTLSYLKAHEVAEFYRQLSTKHQLGWTESRIKSLAGITGGYPLRMKEIALRELIRMRRDPEEKERGLVSSPTPDNGRHRSWNPFGGTY